MWLSHGMHRKRTSLKVCTLILFSHNSFWIFAVTMSGTPHAVSLCSQSVSQSGGKQAGRCWAPICLLSLSRLLSPHHSPKHTRRRTHVTHNNNTHRWAWYRSRGGGVSRGRKRKENLCIRLVKKLLGKCSAFWQFICCMSDMFFTVTLWTKITFLSLSFGLHNNEWPAAVATSLSASY